MLRTGDFGGLSPDEVVPAVLGCAEAAGRGSAEAAGGGCAGMALAGAGGVPAVPEIALVPRHPM